MPRKKTGFLKLGIMFAVICLVILAPGYLRLRKIKKEVADMRRNIKLLEEENAGLRTEIDKLEHDPFAIEKKAREKLGMVREGEIKFKFVSQETSAVEKTKKKKR